MGTPLRLLLIEDDEDDAELLLLELARGGFDIECRRIETEPDLRAALEEQWDLIISDFLMPELSGLRGFEVYRELSCDVPFIFISGTLGEERAVEAMRAGARDYFLKGKLARLNVAVRRELERTERLRERRLAEEAMMVEQRRLAMAVEASGAGIWELRLSPVPVCYISERSRQILGIRLDEVPSGHSVLDWIWARTHPDDVDYRKAELNAFLSGKKERYRVAVRMLRGDGQWIDVAASAKAVSYDDAGKVTQMVGVLMDMSDRRQLEAQLRQAQKMEAVGQLAGGIAHDFNNLLTAILSFGSFVQQSLRPDEPAYEDMAEVLKAGRSAEALTSQLLAFSRKKAIAPRVMNANDVVNDTERLLARLLRADVEVQMALQPKLWNVYMDPSALEQVVINIAVNARDAMPSGGKLIIETYNADLDEGYPTSHGRVFASGQYAVVALTDEGAGMEEEVHRRIFEPFFTTKSPGVGTGLGLSTCYGIVKQAGGYIWVYSEPGRGTTFKIYLPRAKEAVTDSPAPPALPSTLTGHETILVAEDDVQVRRLVSRALSSLGYDVLESDSGVHAIRLSEETTQPIHLLLSDFIMPGMTGRELAERLRSARSGLKVLYMSGYTSNALAHRGMHDSAARLLQKPFTPDQLAKTVREVLDG